MLVITKGQAGQTLIVTLSERRTSDGFYYLFVFSNTTTSDVVTRQYHYSDDISDYPDRYNEFLIDAGLFVDAADGQYKYTVYQKKYSYVVDDYTGLLILECGQMLLKPATPITRKGYAATTETRKGYGG